MKAAPILISLVFTACSGDDLGSPFPPDSASSGSSGASGSSMGGSTNASGSPSVSMGGNSVAGSTSSPGGSAGSSQGGTSGAGSPGGGSPAGGASDGGSSTTPSGGMNVAGSTAGNNAGGNGGRSNVGGASGSMSGGEGGQGRGGFGMGGRGTGTAGTGGSSGATSSSASCAVLLSGATGEESMGQIPACCVPNTSEKAFVDEAFRLLNEYRMSLGLSAFAYDDALALAIQGHSVHQAVHPFRLSHDAPESSVRDFQIRAMACSAARASGENIAWNYRTPADVMTGWRESSGHDQNMRGNHTRVGIGYHLSSSREHWWGQLFGR